MNDDKKFRIMFIIYLFMFVYTLIGGRSSVNVSVGSKCSINHRELLKVKNGIDKYKKDVKLTEEDQVMINKLTERYNFVNSEFNEYYSFPLSEQLSNPERKYNINQMIKELLKDYNKFMDNK